MEAEQKRGRLQGRPLRFQLLSFPPEPFGMPLAPVGMALFIAADQNAEADAGFPVALFAELVEADNFRLRRALRMGR